jgi:exonuclease SbcC
MPDSPPEITSTEKRLRSFLVETFSASQAVLSSAADAPHPLLLLHLEHELAGFALSNGDPRGSFEQSYSFFKKLYADRHREWDELNLTFVLCLSHRDRELEAFCARIETDVFFCRKFAVALDAKWEIELARLPFFPLERKVGGFRRPPSAQTLLKSCGVSPTLAASIVGRVGEESIVEDCLSGPVPKLVASDTLGAQIAIEDAIQAIRVQRVEIENFRAYRRPQSFDLDADVIVLYGPNGFGKTSFFDAIDFAATGDIGR